MNETNHFSNNILIQSFLTIFGKLEFGKMDSANWETANGIRQTGTNKSYKFLIWLFILENKFSAVYTSDTLARCLILIRIGHMASEDNTEIMINVLSALPKTVTSHSSSMAELV